MADRYWVGGTASWDGTAGTKWATTSGGGGGAAVPTTADDVFFDSVSSGTVTIATGNTGAKSINCTGFAGTITGTVAISVAGSITLSSGMTYTHTGIVTVTATATITTSGKTFSALTVTGGTVTLGDAINTGTRDLTTTGGTFDTAGFSVTAGRCVTTGTTARTILWRTSTVTVSGTFGTNFSGTNLTFTAGTSSLVLTGSDASMSNNSSGFALTFYDVSFTSTAGTSRGLSPNTTHNNLTIVGPAADSIIRVTAQGNFTVNGTLSVTGTSETKRIGFLSNTLGTARTATVATLSAPHCDFEDIALAGAASPASPTGAGDCGGNTNITFPAAKSVYRVGTSTLWAEATGWAASSGGTGSSANFPLPQDTAYVDNATTGTSLTIAAYNNSALDMSARTVATTLNVSVAASFYGSFILGSGVTPSGTSTQTYRGRGTSTLTTAGKTIAFIIATNSVGGTLQLGSALTSTSRIDAGLGTFNANNYNVTCTIFAGSGSAVRTITMGSGLWTLTSTGTVWDTGTVTNLTFNKDTADILLSNTTTGARSFTGGGLSYNKLTIGGATGISTLTLTGANTFTELASTKTVAHTIRLATSAGTIGVWSVTGRSGGVVTLNSTTTGTRRTFNLSNATSEIDYMAVQDIEVLQANRFYVGANSTDNGNNVNVLFSASPSVSVLVTGLSATGAVGTATVITAVDVSVSVTGQAVTGSVGAAAISSDVDTTVTGLSSSAGVGSATASGTASTDVTGQEASGFVGVATVTTSSVIPVSVSVTGQSATSSVGLVATFGDANIFPAGVPSSGVVGQASPSGDANTTVTGQGAAAIVGTVTVLVPASVSVAVNGVSALGRVGSAVVIQFITVNLTGVSASAAVGAAIARASIAIPVVGVQATSGVGVVSELTTGSTKVWTGSAWKVSIIKVYTPLGWRPENAKIWNGVSWEFI